MNNPSNPFVAAFDVGVCLNKLSWHLLQAVVCCSRQHDRAAAEVMTKLEVLLVQLYPQDRGGLLRKKVEEARIKWTGFTDNEWFNEMGWDLMYNLNLTRTDEALTEAIDTLVEQVPMYDRDVERELWQELSCFPSMQNALNLGKCIDEGRHVPGQHAKLIVLQSDDEEPLAPSRGQPTAAGTGPAMPADNDSEFGPVPRRQTGRLIYKPKTLEPGEIRPAGSWKTEVQLLWQSAPIATPCPEVTEDQLGSPVELQTLVQRLIDAARWGLSERDYTSWNGENIDNELPYAPAGQEVNPPVPPFVYGRHEKAIMDALRGKALKKDQLAQVVFKGDSSRLYKPGGLKRLRDKGLVDNLPGLGYYRLDAPPPGLTPNLPPYPPN